jgi:hypothetical protein
MIVCDRCKKIPSKAGKNEPFLYELTGTKVEETRVGKKGAAAGREIVKITMHLCEGCITSFNRDLGYFISGIRENETVEIDNNPARPVGMTERDFGHDEHNAENRTRGEDDPTLMANEQFVSRTK